MKPDRCDVGNTGTWIRNSVLARMRAVAPSHQVTINYPASPPFWPTPAGGKHTFIRLDCPTLDLGAFWRAVEGLSRTKRGSDE